MKIYKNLFLHLGITTPINLLLNRPKIWRATIPNKVKNFTWRATKNIMPTRANLEKKGVVLDTSCPLCGLGYIMPTLSNYKVNFVCISIRNSHTKWRGLGSLVSKVAYVWRNLEGLNFFALSCGWFGKRGTMLCSRIKLLNLLQLPKKPWNSFKNTTQPIRGWSQDHKLFQTTL